MSKIAELEAKSNKKIRCVGCLGWTDSIWAIGFWFPDRNKPFRIDYPLCEQCAGAVRAGGKKAMKVSKTAEAYLQDRLAEVQS